MIWNGKRFEGMQLYKKRGENDYLLVDLTTGTVLTSLATGEKEIYYMCVGELFIEPYPDKVTPSSGQVSGQVLDEDFYPLSQCKMYQLTGHEKWVEVFDEEFEFMLEWREEQKNET